MIKRDGDWYIAYCPEIPGLTVRAVRRDEARQNLAERIELILEDRREDALVVPPMRFARLSRSDEAEHGAISNDKEVLTRYGRTRAPALSKRFLVTPKFLTALAKFVVFFRSRKLARNDSCLTRGLRLM
jgi:predicted RNase H-like HicB family nuclease